MITDVSGQPVAPILNSHLLGPIFLDYWTVEDETDKLSRNIGNQPLTHAAYYPTERRPQYAYYRVLILCERSEVCMAET